jgi:DNA-binding MarR family transcriptional regulator
MSNVGVEERRQRAAGKYAAFEGKRYLRMLVTKEKCPLTHSERLVLSYRAYKARDGRNLSISKIASTLGLDRHTVSKSVERLVQMGLYVDNPLTVKPEWFSKPHDDGSPRCYRHYLMESGMSELDIPYAVISETFSNRWKLRVIKVFSGSAWIVGRPSRVSRIAA